jgi:hypothetical protein
MLEEVKDADIAAQTGPRKLKLQGCKANNQVAFSLGPHAGKEMPGRVWLDNLPHLGGFPVWVK